MSVIDKFYMFINLIYVNFLWFLINLNVFKFKKNYKVNFNFKIDIGFWFLKIFVNYIVLF